MLENERELRQKFEDMVEQYAQQHSKLEAEMRHEYHLKDPSAGNTNTLSSVATSVPDGADAAAASLGEAAALDNLRLTSAAAAVGHEVTSGSGSDDDDDFHDAMTDQDEVFTISAPPCYGSTDLRLVYVMFGTQLQ